jgi:Uncharacterized conserved protein
MKTSILSLAAATLIAAAVQAEHHGDMIETYEIDTAHSSVKFSIRHFVTRPPATRRVSGTLKIDRHDLTTAARSNIRIPSVDTTAIARRPSPGG